MLLRSASSIAIHEAPEHSDRALAEAGLDLDRKELGVLAVLEHRHDWALSMRFAIRSSAYAH